MRLEITQRTGRTLFCYIQRVSDEKYFNGSTFQDDPYPLPFAEKIGEQGTYYLEYSDTLFSDGTYLVKTRDANKGDPAGFDTYFIVKDGETMPEPDPVVFVDHNYGGNDNLRFVDEGGNGISEAYIRCWLTDDYENGNYDALIAWTMTKNDGRWVAPLPLPPGHNYTLVFSKPPEAGETRYDITV